MKSFSSMWRTMGELRRFVSEIFLECSDQVMKRNILNIRLTARCIAPLIKAGVQWRRWTNHLLVPVQSSLSWWRQFWSTKNQALSFGSTSSNCEKSDICCLVIVWSRARLIHFILLRFSIKNFFFNWSFCYKVFSIWYFTLWRQSIYISLDSCDSQKAAGPCMKNGRYWSFQPLDQPF